MNKVISLDARMLKASGIGTILSNIIPRILTGRPDWTIRLLGEPRVLGAQNWASAPNVRIVPYTSPIYSVAEQTEWPGAAVAGSDMVWSPNYNVPLRWRGRLMVTINDLAHLALPEVFPGLTKRLFARTMFSRVRRVADTIVFISHFSEQEFGRLVGTPNAHTSVVHCGVAPDWFRVKHPPNPGTPYFLFVGNVKPHKNLSRLLLAFERIKNDVPHKLMIAGKKEGFITGDEGAQDMEGRFGGRVEFTGYLSDETLRGLIAGADALVLPSFYEGFGLPPLEAMAANCPAITSRCASMPEVCGTAAAYFDPMDIDDIAEVVKRVLCDSGLREDMRARGLARASELTWERSAVGYTMAIEATLTSRCDGTRA